MIVSRLIRTLAGLALGYVLRRWGHLIPTPPPPEAPPLTMFGFVRGFITGEITPDDIARDLMQMHPDRLEAALAAR